MSKPERWIVVRWCCVAPKSSLKLGTVFEALAAEDIGTIGVTWRCNTCGLKLRTGVILKFGLGTDYRARWFPRDWCRQLPDLTPEDIQETLEEGLPA